MKYEKYCKKISKIINSISQILIRDNIDFTQNGPILTIKLPDEDNTIKNDIKNIISTVFHTKKASKYCKINYLESKLYLHFKQCAM